MRWILQPFHNLDSLGSAGLQVHETLAGRDSLHLGDRADPEALFAAADLVAPLDQHDSKMDLLGFQSIGKHDQIPLFEDSKPERHVWQQHRPQGKHRQHRHDLRQPSAIGWNTGRSLRWLADQSSRSRTTASASNRPESVKINRSSADCTRSRAARWGTLPLSATLSSVTARPSASRRSSNSRSTCLSTDDTISRAWAGLWPAASRSA